MMNVNITEEFPQNQEYMDLKAVTGLPEVEISAIATALNRSVLSLLARDDNDRLIGMGRVVGDGAFYFQLVDIMVAASHLDQGVEEMIVSELLSRLKKIAPSGAEVTVITDVPGIKLYQHAGFKLLYPDRYGMARSV
ncbi:GNAT family N-acetyltransferase [Paenibacillus sp. p3-SID867]|uniref:GNAT family N-acetyltransferase n=1 Tax=Paenibacillus sp. p3-SID867 TaxID=2916363 RepID=UPI0021A389F5|nr:GNAT family N-acetyltransferase [Paenibacillus sp. p3-SID867]MCT1403949.1 GNAT family N-acetyltransferase [Paenibacillus sp. p3-SID867]